MASAYRYEDTRRGTQGRTRTGLAGVGTGNGGAAPYQLAALQPGMRGFWASGFGAAPTGETPDRQPDTPPAPAATQTAAPTVPQQAPYRVPEASGGEASNATMMGPEPANHDLFGDFSVSGKTLGSLGGALAGGLIGGPVGGLIGAVGGRLLGSMYDDSQGASDGMASGAFSGNEQLGQDMNQAANNENASAGPSAEIADAAAAEAAAAAGLAKGGKVTPGHLQHGKAAMQQHGKKGAGLRGVGMGGGYMGAFGMGGKVPNYADGGMVDEQALAGPDPAGPDDGFAALDGGEYVVRAAQAQRPDYAPILEAMNQGVYEPQSDMGGDAGGEPIYTYGAQTMDATTTAHAAALGDGERMVLLQAMQASPEIEGALTALLGPEGMALLQAQNRPADAVDNRSVMAARAPLAGPPPVPGTAAPPGFPPPAQRRGGLAAVANG